MVEPQPAVAASSSAYARTDRPAVMVTAPAASKCRVADLGAALGDQAGRQRQCDCRHRDVHPEHPLPAEAVGEDAAEQDTGCAGRTRDGAPGAQRLVALGTVLKEAGDDREGGRRDDRGAQALCRTGGDQLALVRGEPGRQRSDPDDNEARHEDAAPAEQIGSPAAEQQEAAEGDHVGVHHPGQVGLREVQALADARQSHVDDGRVEHHDELGDAEQDQRGPPSFEIFLSGFHPPRLLSFSAGSLITGSLLRRMAKAGLDKSCTFIRNLTSGFG